MISIPSSQKGWWHCKSWDSPSQRRACRPQIPYIDTSTNWVVSNCKYRVDRRQLLTWALIPIKAQGRASVRNCFSIANASETIRWTSSVEHRCLRWLYKRHAKSYYTSARWLIGGRSNSLYASPHPCWSTRLKMSVQASTLSSLTRRLQQKTQKRKCLPRMQKPPV